MFLFPVFFRASSCVLLISLIPVEFLACIRLDVFNSGCTVESTGDFIYKHRHTGSTHGWGHKCIFFFFFVKNKTRTNKNFPDDLNIWICNMGLSLTVLGAQKMLTKVQIILEKIQ